ncbi:hypothetical protein ES703_99572 [subsurface metagenome]
MKKLTKEQRSKIMRAIKSKWTKMEQWMRMWLVRKGYRGWVAHKEGMDFVFPKKKIGIMMMGCFWHCCPKCFRLPKTNRKFWKEKFRKNIQRDKKLLSKLRKAKWKIIMIWGHEHKTGGEQLAKKMKLLEQYLQK